MNILFCSKVYISMVTIYFESTYGCVLYNSKVIDSYLKTSESIIPIVYIPYNENQNAIFTIIKVQDSSISNNRYFESTEISSGCFYISFIKEQIYLPQPQAYFQEEIQLNQSHYFTAYHSNGSYFFTIETEQEIYNTITPHKLSNITIKSAKISDGYLITIFAYIENQKYINILFYDDDYISLLNCICDDISFNDNEILITDKIQDSLHRSITRHYSFQDGLYKELSREFSYNINPAITTYSLPYVFLESIFSQDYEYAKKYCNPNSFENILTSIGNFDKIVLLDNIYKQNIIHLLYKKESQNLIKSFDFQIDNLLINDVIELLH